jgi:hypothetical protein
MGSPQKDRSATVTMNLTRLEQLQVNIQSQMDLFPVKLPVEARSSKTTESKASKQIKK